MTSGGRQESPMGTGRSGEPGGYEAPTIVVLGTFAELTQQGQAPTDELFNDGSQA